MTHTGSASSPVRSTVVDALKRFLGTESSGAKVLGLATLLALAWANSPISSSYAALWSTPLPDALTLSGNIPDLRHLINDGAMTLFFLVVGLEIKRELVSGELSSVRSAALPAIAAVGGIVVPAAIYALFNSGTATGSGWGIPIATDIAFVVALLVAFGSRIPVGLKVFLLSLAIVDDIVAIATIAIFYTDDLQVTWLLVMGAVTMSLALASRSRVLRGWAIIPAGLLLWASAVFAGIHPTVAGVLLAFTMSIGDGEGISVEDRLHPWTGLVVIPLFGLANTGVLLSLSDLGDAVSSSAGLGIIVGLVLGKAVGVSLFSWIAVRTGIGELPAGVTWGHLIGAAAAAGIGFTMSLFITDLAFHDQRLIADAKLAIFVASVISALLSSLILRSQAAR